MYLFTLKAIFCSLSPRLLVAGDGVKSRFLSEHTPRKHFAWNTKNDVIFESGKCELLNCHLQWMKNRNFRWIFWHSQNHLHNSFSPEGSEEVLFRVGWNTSVSVFSGLNLHTSVSLVYTTQVWRGTWFWCKKREKAVWNFYSYKLKLRRDWYTRYFFSAIFTRNTYFVNCLLSQTPNPALKGVYSKRKVFVAPGAYSFL